MRQKQYFVLSALSLLLSVAPLRSFAESAKDQLRQAAGAAARTALLSPVSASPVRGEVFLSCEEDHRAADGRFTGIYLVAEEAGAAGRFDVDLTVKSYRRGVGEVVEEKTLLFAIPCVFSSTDKRIVSCSDDSTRPTMLLTSKKIVETYIASGTGREVTWEFLEITIIRASQPLLEYRFQLKNCIVPLSAHP